MHVAIHAADLDHDRIDGTRVYILNMLKNFGKIDCQNFFTIYHKNRFNPRLEPPQFANYKIKKIPWPIFWTQFPFAWQLLWDNPEVLWMPMHNAPLFRRKNMKIVVTFHDLAYKLFPEYFPKRDLRKLNALTDLAIRRADRIIAVSQSTKNDILKFYPQFPEEKIFVIHHGFDKDAFAEKISTEESKATLENHGLKAENYLLYVGAIQPRKDLITLVDAFEKTKEKFPDMKLMLAGAPAWHFEQTLLRIAQSKFANDIIVTGTVSFEEVRALYQNCAAFVFPPLYEGFGIPILEAFASGAPTILARNSALIEVGGGAAQFFKTGDSEDLAQIILNILSSSDLRAQMVAKGYQRAKDFSWEKSAKRTLDIITKW